jgi:flavin reductase (DIM6/NTAB) family NADH-FMN oxidoreductase RutF
MSPPFPPSRYISDAVIDCGVALITSAHGERRTVMTASQFSESSFVPVLLRVAIHPATLTHELIGLSGWFGLSVLARNQADLALGCGASSGRDVSKFERHRLRTEPGPRGVPLLPGLLSTSACRVVDRIDVGDHTLFVGEVVASYRQSRLGHLPPLLLSELAG